MALVVLLRGVNVGGHRTFRPKVLAEQLRHLDAVNIGAAGTFVIRKPITMTRLREELARRLPFDTDIMICKGRDLLALTSREWFTGQPKRPDIVRFVSVLAKTPRRSPPMPFGLPSDDKWLLKVLGREKRFVVGVYRRHMKAVSQFSAFNRLFGVPATTRNWNTMTAIERVLVASIT